jgi:hypothetical protein
MATAQETARVRHTLEQLRYDVQDVTQAVETLQSEIGLQLQDQTRLMIRQVELLAQIAETLRTPARTRAAERISDAGELLRRERYERALTLAQQAIDDDPNNPAGFLAAAWASLGLDDVEPARNYFREAAQASDGDQRQTALRQAARLTFLLEGPQAALKELGDSPEQLSPAEEGATDFDRAVYFSNAGESTAAAECLREASYIDGRLCLMALTDPILSRDATVAETAAEQLRAIRAVADPAAAEFRRAHARYQALRKEIEDSGLAEKVWKWRERRDKEWQNVLQQLPDLPYYGLHIRADVQANARKALAVVDEDERALPERRAEEVLNEHLAREFDKGWWVVKRWKLHAAVGKATKSLWWGESYGVREVGLDPSGKVISTKVRARRDASYNGKYFMFSTSGGDVAEGDMPQPGDVRAVPARCEYCWCVTWRNLNICNAGELELFS